MYITLTKNRLAAFICVLLLTVLVGSEFSRVRNMPQDGKTNSRRVDFASSVGCSVDETPVSVRKIYIPDSFSEAYRKYNLLQQKAGYDLTGYKGCNALLYTYSVKEGGIVNEDTVLNLIVYKNRIIGGDISSLSANGKKLPIKK